VNIWQSYKQERRCLVRFVSLSNTLLKDEESARDDHVLFVTLPNIHRFYFFSLSDSAINLCLLTVPPHLKYTATLPCNLSLMACFADINISQGSVATYSRCGRISSMVLTANLPNLPRNLPVKMCKSVKI